jgi:hypothetical protein
VQAEVLLVIVTTVSICVSILGRQLTDDIGTYFEEEWVTAHWWCAGGQPVGPHCVTSVHRVYLSVICKHVHTHTHTHTQSSTLSFLGAWSWDIPMLWSVGWTRQSFRREEPIVVDNLAIHNYKVCLSHVSFQIGSIWCHKPKDTNLNYVWIFHFLVFLVPYRHMVSFLCLMHCIICSSYGRDPESFQRSGSHLWSLGTRRVAQCMWNDIHIFVHKEETVTVVLKMVGTTVKMWSPGQLSAQDLYTHSLWYLIWHVMSLLPLYFFCLHFLWCWVLKGR